MIINITGLEYTANPENSAVFRGETMMNGMYTDLDDDYAFIPQELPDYDLVVVQAVEEGIPIYDLVEYDPQKPPYCFIINALCRVFRDEIEHGAR